MFSSCLKKHKVEAPLVECRIKSLFELLHVGSSGDETQWDTGSILPSCHVFLQPVMSVYVV